MSLEGVGRWPVVWSFLLTLGSQGLDAQSVREAPLPALATLALWADDVWLALADRDGSYFGRLAEQGTFQRFNPLMDAEYEMDVRTGLFAPAEDARWAPVRRGLRVAGASINHPFILNFAEWREEIPIAGPVRLLARHRRQRSLTVQRDYPQVGLAWRDALGSSWALRSSIGMHFFKPSADVEVGLTGGWGEGEAGRTRWTLDVRLALLDAFNNVIFNSLGVEPEETEAHFNYERLPFAARLGLVRTSSSTHFEVHAGRTRRSIVLVSFPATGDPQYALVERVSFVGALAEVVASPRLSLAAYGTTARAETGRVLALPAAPRFLRLREETRALGLRARWTTGPVVALEMDLSGLWRPEDRDSEEGARLRHRDRELFAQLALAARPATGWVWRLGYAFMDRDAGAPLALGLAARNHRQLMEGGYRFASGFEVTAGLRWDLDQGLARPFDGGHLRLVATW